MLVRKTPIILMLTISLSIMAADAPGTGHLSLTGDAEHVEGLQN